MSKNLFITLALLFALVAVAAAQQNANSSTPVDQPIIKRGQTAPTPTPAPVAPEVVAPKSRTRRATNPARAATAAAEQEVRATFDALLRAVEKRDVDAVMNFYWNSPQLLIFNNNGTVTRGWTQMRANLASLYPELKDVKIAATDVRVSALGADYAGLTCRWSQSQEFKGTPETSAGRMTDLFRRAGGAGKIAHRHTSPEAPDPSRMPASEQAAPTPQPTPPPESF